MRHLSLTNRHRQYRCSPIYLHLQLGQQMYQHYLDKRQRLYLVGYHHDRPRLCHAIELDQEAMHRRYHQDLLANLE